jgi:hypothetical protein
MRALLGTTSRTREGATSATPAALEDALCRALEQAWLNPGHPIRIRFCLELAGWIDLSARNSENAVNKTASTGSRSSTRAGRFPAR